MAITNIVRKYIKKSKEDRDRIKELKSEIDVAKREIKQIKAKYEPKI